MSQVYAVYNPELDRADVIDFGGQQERFGQVMALLATGLEDPGQTAYFFGKAIGGESETIPHASELLHRDNFQRAKDAVIESARQHRMAVAIALSELDLLMEFSQAEGGLQLF